MRKLMWGAVLALTVVASLIFISLNWTYSDGQRVGYMQKLTHKGWLCKTWEGELKMMTPSGTATGEFKFTVQDPGLAAGLGELAGQRVVVHYQQHKGIPTSCFGDTAYFVIAARRATG